MYNCFFDNIDSHTALQDRGEMTNVVSICICFFFYFKEHYRLH